MAKEKKDLFAGLKQNILNNTPETPRQTVTPVKEKTKPDESPFTLYIPTEMMKKLKLLSATEGRSLKQLINEALEEKYSR